MRIVRVIPIELISTIYEEFYNAKVGDGQNQAHTTPRPHSLSLCSAHADSGSLGVAPRVFDPLVVRGYFWSKAFRRMVRHQWAAQADAGSIAGIIEDLEEQIAALTSTRRRFGWPHSVSVWLCSTTSIRPKSIPTGGCPI